MSDLVRVTIDGWSYMVSEEIVDILTDVIENPDNYISGLDDEDGEG